MIHFVKILEAQGQGEETTVKLKIDKNIMPQYYHYAKAGQVYGEFKLNDGRHITHLQRKKIYATINDISTYTGDVPEYLKEILKYKYCIESGERYFSLSDCDVTTARLFINYLIEFCIRWDIPLSEQAIQRTDDIDNYLYCCIKYRTCAITGKKNADIHHCIGSRVGMGNNRNKINNAGRKLIALSREWHNKVHQEGEEDIFKKYKIYGITIDNETLKGLGLNVNDIN